MTKYTEKKINAIVEEILDEDQENDFDVTPAETCPGGCEELNNSSKDTPRQCRCGVENSSRFSLRVMEAMRSLQRDVDQPSTSTAEEIADYIRLHYRYDGDLYAQVRTALRQVCSQGMMRSWFAQGNFTIVQLILFRGYPSIDILMLIKEKLLIAYRSLKASFTNLPLANQLVSLLKLTNRIAVSIPMDKPVGQLNEDW